MFRRLFQFNTGIIVTAGIRRRSGLLRPEALYFLGETF
jgi:hypothetical protein